MEICNMLFDISLTITLDQLLSALLLNYVQITPIPSIVVTFFLWFIFTKLCIEVSIYLGIQQ